MVYAKDNYLALEFIKYTNIANVESACIKDAIIACMLLVGVCVYVSKACSVCCTCYRGNINNNNNYRRYAIKTAATPQQHKLE